MNRTGHGQAGQHPYHQAKAERPAGKMHMDVFGPEAPAMTGKVAASCQLINRFCKFSRAMDQHAYQPKADPRETMRVDNDLSQGRPYLHKNAGTINSLLIPFDHNLGQVLKRVGFTTGQRQDFPPSLFMCFELIDDKSHTNFQTRNNVCYLHHYFTIVILAGSFSF